MEYAHHVNSVALRAVEDDVRQHRKIADLRTKLGPKSADSGVSRDETFERGNDSACQPLGDLGPRVVALYVREVASVARCTEWSSTLFMRSAPFRADRRKISSKLRGA